MALIECWECGGQVSDHAVLCPHCGAPQGRVSTPPRRRSGWRWVRRLLFVLVFAGVFVMIARRKGWIDDELMVRARSGMPSEWSGLCEPLQRWAKSGEEVA